MLEVQKYFREHGPNALQENFDISTTVSPCGRLGILNYGTKSPKTHPYTLESRSLVLELETGNVVAKTFNRFFNFHECLEIHKNFNWNNFIVEEKCDGSLVYVYYYDGSWRVNTRNSFANGLIDGYNGTWQQLFLEAGGYKVFEYLNRLNPKDFVFIFELGSLFNKVVKEHRNPTLFLLSVVNNLTLKEPFDYLKLNSLAALMGVKRPQVYLFNTLDDILATVDTLPPTDEGYVANDGNMRIKFKNKGYLALHALKGNNNLFLVKYLVPLFFTKEADKDEVLTYYPEVSEKMSQIETHCIKLKQTVAELWEENKHLKDRKEFALKVKDSPYCSFLFNLYKGQPLDSVICSGQAENWVIEYLKRKGIT
jgi:hypothetical protein